MWLRVSQPGPRTMAWRVIDAAGEVRLPSAADHARGRPDPPGLGPTRRGREAATRRGPGAGNRRNAAQSAGGSLRRGRVGAVTGSESSTLVRERLRFVDFELRRLQNGRCRARVVLEWHPAEQFIGSAEE